MHFSAILTSAAFAGAALAKDIPVAVGNKDGGLTFNPATITAEEGDVVLFHFWPKSHSVAQAAFDKPCEPLNGGFWSGFVPTNDTEAASDTHFMYTVSNASAPIWFYCSAMRHCQNGMVGVINPPQNNPNRTLEAFAEAAAQASENVSPQGSPTQEDGIMLMNGTDNHSDDQPPASESSSAAASLPVKDFAVSGVLGLFAYMLF